MRQRDTLIEHIVDTGNLTNVGMEKGDLGLTMSTL